MKKNQYILPSILLLSLYISCFGPFDPENPNIGKGSNINSNNSTQVTDTSIAYWKCDDSGKTYLRNYANDSTRNKGDLYNIDYDTGFNKSGYSLKFVESRSSKVTVMHDSTFNIGTKDFTISLWCKPFKASHDTVTFLSKGLKDSSNTFSMACTNKKLIVMLGKSRYFSISESDTLNDSVWNHVALTRKEHKLYLYTNNKQFKPDVIVHDLSNSNRLYLGMDAREDHRYNGNLDELKIELKAWDALDVSNEYAKKGN